MEFREFIEEDEAELFEEGLESMDEWIGSALKFTAGAAGNALSQTARAAGNIGAGATQGAYGLGQGVLSAAQRAGGGGDEAEKTFKRASSNIGRGIGRIARGVAQGVGVATGVSPILRGAQAMTEPVGISGVLAPAGKNRTPFQNLVGLDSWERPKTTPRAKPKAIATPKTTPRAKPKAIATPQPTPGAKPKAKQPAIATPKPAAKPKAEDEAGEFLHDLGREEKTQMRRIDPDQKKPQPEAWKTLVTAYKAAKSSEERKEIRQRMMLVNPYLYQQAVEAGKRSRFARASKEKAS